MIRFDATQLAIDFVQLKSITTSLGGSISIIDDQKSTDQEEVTRRVAVPMALARTFIKTTQNVTKYLRPVWIAMVRYGDHVVALERHPMVSLGTLEIEGPFGTKRWIPNVERLINDHIIPTVTLGDKEWYFDGRYVYSFDQADLNTTVRNGRYLSADGHFRKIVSQTIDLQSTSSTNTTNDAGGVNVEERNCLAFVASNGDFVVSPPIWKDLEGVGGKQRKSITTDDEDEDDLEDGTVQTTINNVFDIINQSMSVNLNFALKAGQEVGKMFGYEYVEPLQLSRLMIELHTVNLPNVPKQVKATYDCGMRFSHAMAWVMGLSRRANTLETHLIMRSLLSYLTKKGIFRSDAFDADSVFLPNMGVADVHQKEIDELIGNMDFTKMSLANILAAAKENRKSGRQMSLVDSGLDIE